MSQTSAEKAEQAERERIEQEARAKAANDAPAGTPAPDPFAGKGMFATDHAFGGSRLDLWINVDVPFILWDARIAAEDIPTDLGTATKTEMLVSSVEAADQLLTVSTLASAIGDKVRRKADPDPDLPAIVYAQRVGSSFSEDRDALVLSFLSRHTGQLPAADLATAWSTAKPAPQPIEDPKKKGRARR